VVFNDGNSVALMWAAVNYADN